MNRNFYVLWFEDEELWYKSKLRRLESSLSEHHLKLEPQREKNGNVKDAILLDNKYDLILVDYELTRETGDKIIERIRSLGVLTDILLYSSQYEEMLQKIKEIVPPFDGIYYANRNDEEFDDKIQRLIRKIIKRSEDLNNIRGFVFDKSCDFEIRIKEILNSCWHNFSGEAKRAFQTAILKKTQTLSLPKKDKFNSLIADTDAICPKVINSDTLITHSDRLSLLNDAIELLANNYDFSIKGKYKNFKLNYEEDLSIYKKALGQKKKRERHIKIKGKQIPIDQPLHQKLIAKIHEYDELILKLEYFVMKMA